MIFCSFSNNRPHVQMMRCTLFFIVITGLLLWFPPCSGKGVCQPAHTGILLADGQGNVLYSQNLHTPLIPASTLKILTSLAALKSFEKGFRYTAKADYDTASKSLKIKGFGDPLFISEIIQDFCLNLIKTKGLCQATPVRQIILDPSYFDPDIHIPGTGSSLNPYDATTGALCANFNTVMFKTDPVSGTPVSAEPQTPLPDIFITEIKKTGLAQGRILLSPDQRKVYPGLLIRHFLKENGIPVTGEVTIGPFGPDSDTVFSYHSLFSMEDIVQRLLKFSNNFIANQILLTMGARAYGPPATLEKGINALETFAKEGLGLTGIELAEGSGLSRKNRVTPFEMGKILTAFSPYHTLLQENQTEYYKTGTLSDVRCRAGYIKSKDNTLYPFVIMVNQKGQGYAAILRDLIDRANGLKGPKPKKQP